MMRIAFSEYMGIPLRNLEDWEAGRRKMPDARHASTYWAVLKKRMKNEGAIELLTNCKQLKLKAVDGKRRFTDAANTSLTCPKV